ncbi:MAG: O-antigen ligase family protein [Bacteroidales bacterium]|nr:O-antigen ligase family protein [Bacteroidales bacterium]
MKELYWGMLIPLGLLFGLLYIFHLDKVLLFIAFVTPFSITLQDMDMGVAISMPSEPMLIGVLLLFFIKLFYEEKVDFSGYRNPLAILVIVHILWMFITSITGELPMVSFKYLFSRLWFLVPMFFLAILFFKRPENITRLIWAYGFSLCGVVLYTTYRHAGFGFDEEIGHWVMDPFYNDHTAYGAILALFIPPFVAITLNCKFGKRAWIFAAIASTLLITGLYLSFSRAAWISIVMAMGILILVLLRIRFYVVFLTSAAVIGLFFAFQQQILDRLEKNKQDSSANFVEHIQSISNISSDASNLERINRWQAALRLYEERKVLGWGPGAYQFVYAPYQLSKEKTIISTNAGDKGNAHSEYIGPLAEQGLPGLIIILLLYSSIVYYGLQLTRKATNRKFRRLTLGITLGLISYFIHGVMNNFLDTDKLSVPFWAFVAALVAIDSYKFHLMENNPSPLSENNPE